MKLKIFAVYDSKAEAFLQPMFFQSKGVAIRAFSSAANSVEHDFHRYAGDYSLFELGEFDDSNAFFLMHATKVNCGTALEHMRALDVPESQRRLILGDDGAVTKVC